MCYPKDFELYLFNKTMTRRYERDVLLPPFWRMDNCYDNVRYTRQADLAAPAEIRIRADGKYNVVVNTSAGPVYQHPKNDRVLLPAGKFVLEINVYSDCRLPALFVTGAGLESGEGWSVTCNDHVQKKVRVLEEIPPEMFPSDFRLPTREIPFVKKWEQEGKTVYDFGRELMAYVRFEGALGGSGHIYYGESVEEALDWAACELCDEATLSGECYVTPIAKAFRYLTFEGLRFDRVTALYEYAPQPFRSEFTCSDEKLNRIYEIALYTLELNSREFFLDGIKRDRWVWSGDATQSYLVNFYSLNNSETVKRTMLALLGKEPFRTHVNHIMDYTFYWLLSLKDYYLYTGDAKFIEDNFEEILALTEFCIGRTDENGLLEGYPQDWVFVDWADDLDNRGEVAVEQMLYAAALGTVSYFCKLFDRKADGERYEDLRKSVIVQLEKFWDEKEGCYLYNFRNGACAPLVTRHPNLFAVLLDLADGRRKQRIRDRVLLNDRVPALKTPYMRFYELSALCELGEHEYVLGEISDYWGGMLDEGATSFWERYDPAEKGKERYAMYGRAYGKSLCHAWGASPLYLIGRYFVGLRPTEPGYEKFELRPNLGGLSFFRAKLPVNDGVLEIEYSGTRLQVYSDRHEGTVLLPADAKPEGTFERTKDGVAIRIRAGVRYDIAIA